MLHFQSNNKKFSGEGIRSLPQVPSPDQFPGTEGENPIPSTNAPSALDLSTLPPLKLKSGYARLGPLGLVLCGLNMTSHYYYYSYHCQDY